LSFLESGGSDYPLEILRRAGVDLETPAPYDATFRAMDRKLDLLEALLDA
jgi:oligoendopeptidase F